MKKNIAIITFAFVLGLLCCDLVSAQMQQHLGRRTFNPGLLENIKLTPQPQSQPAINPAMLQPALNSPVNGKLFGTMKPFVTNPLPKFPGLEVTPERQPIQPMPTPPPQQHPQPRPQGPTFQFGTGGPSLSFGSGPHFNIPLGQIGQRFGRPGYYSPPQILSYDPNGKVHTGDATVHGSTFTPGRNLSQLNGTQQQVQQPIYDQFGNLTGYQTGTTWRNSITGQQHGNMTRYTPNGTGGVHQSTTQYSTAGGNITPIGN